MWRSKSSNRMKKLFIPFTPYQNGIGGPSTFMSHLKGFLDERGFVYTEKHDNIKAIFFPIAYDIGHLKKFKDEGVKIIQRLDGVYYPSKHGNEYIALNRDIKEIHNNLADIVIYQSGYSKAQCEIMLGKLADTENHVILNGTDKTIFYPSTHIKKEPGEIRLITTGNFRNPDMIEPVVKALELLKDHFPFRLVTLGNISNESIRHLYQAPYIDRVDNVEKNRLADELRKSDIFIYSHLNPPCPNSVIEAVSCGIPVVGFKSGAMEELLCFNKELLAYVSDDTIQEYKDFDEHKLAEKINLAVNELAYFKQKALENSHLYSFEETGNRYLTIFNEVMKKERATSRWCSIPGIG